MMTIKQFDGKQVLAGKIINWQVNRAGRKEVRTCYSRLNVRSRQAAFGFKPLQKKFAHKSVADWWRWSIAKGAEAQQDILTPESGTAHCQNNWS